MDSVKIYYIIFYKHTKKEVLNLKKSLSFLSRLLLLALLLGLFSVPASAAGETSVYLDGQRLVFDQPPVAMNNRVLVPLRVIFEGLGATVEWDPNDNLTIRARKGSTTVQLTTGSSRMTKQVGSDKQSITLDVAPIALNNRTLVPVRAVSEAFDCQVSWDGSANRVNISTEPDHRVILNFFSDPDEFFGNGMFDGDTFYFSFIRRSMLYVYDGSTLRSFSAGGMPMNILPRDGKAYYYTLSSEAVYCLDTATGEREILFNGDGGVEIQDLMLYRDYLLVTSESQLHAVNVNTKKVVLVHEKAASSSQVLVTASGGKIFVLDTGGTTADGVTAALEVTMVNPDTGASQSIYSQSSVGGGIRFIPDMDGQGLYLELEDTGVCLFFDAATGQRQAVTQSVFEAACDAHNVSFPDWDSEWNYGSNINYGMFRQHKETGLREYLYDGKGCHIFAINSSCVAFLQSENATTPGSSSFGNSAVYIMNTDGSNLVELVNNWGDGGPTSSGGSGDTGGSGALEPITCTVCGGSGRMTCSLCNGSGFASGKSCSYCGGSGWLLCSGCNGAGLLYPHR